MITFCIVVFLIRSIVTFFKTLDSFGGPEGPMHYVVSLLVDIAFVTIGCMALWQHWNVHVSIG